MKRTTLLLGLLLAQASPLLAAQAHPADPAVAGPPTTYRSAFDGYRPATEEPIADWRTLNEDVAAIGGHVGIMKGASGSPPNHPHHVPPPPREGSHRHGSGR